MAVTHPQARHWRSSGVPHGGAARPARRRLHSRQRDAPAAPHAAAARAETPPSTPISREQARHAPHAAVDAALRAASRKSRARPARAASLDRPGCEQARCSPSTRSSLCTTASSTRCAPLASCATRSCSASAARSLRRSRSQRRSPPPPSSPSGRPRPRSTAGAAAAPSSSSTSGTGRIGAAAAPRLAPRRTAPRVPAPHTRTRPPPSHPTLLLHRTASQASGSHATGTGPLLAPQQPQQPQEERRSYGDLFREASGESEPQGREAGGQGGGAGGE